MHPILIAASGQLKSRVGFYPLGEYLNLNLEVFERLIDGVGESHHSSDNEANMTLREPL